jgi:hypothetical protein
MPRTAGGDALLEPLGVPPKEAFRTIGCGVTYGYQLLAAKELESYFLGRARRITVASIRAYVAKKVAEAAGSKAA